MLPPFLQFAAKHSQIPDHSVHLQPELNRRQMNWNPLSPRLAALFLMFAGINPAFTQIPDINEFVFAEEEPQALNLDSVRAMVGYPPAAIEEDAEGTVVARILVDTSGNYVMHRIVREVHPALSAAVEEQMSELRFTPAKQGGKPIMFWVNLPFPFKLIQSEVLIQEQIDLLTEELSADSENYELWHKRGIQYTQLGDYEKANIDFNESLRLNPHKNRRKAKRNTYPYLFYSYYGRAISLLGLERGEEAMADYDEAIRIADEMAIQDSGVTATLGDVYLERAYQYAQMEKHQEAIQDYRVAMAMADSSATCGIWRLVVESGLESNNYSILVEAYDALLECDENAREIYYYSKAYYHRKAGNYEQSILDFRTAINNTTNPSVRLAAQNYLALSQLDAGLPADAMTSVEKAMQMNALSPLAYYVRAQIRMKMEGAQTGCEDLRKALTYGLAGEEMETAIQKLSEVCGIEWEE